jgi:hypothetical protein
MVYGLRDGSSCTCVFFSSTEIRANILFPWQRTGDSMNFLSLKNIKEEIEAGREAFENERKEWQVIT